jgi:hypothetical protein
MSIPTSIKYAQNLRSHGHFNEDIWVDVNGGNLLHGIGGGVQVDQALVDTHFVLVPGLGTVSGWCLTSNDAEDLGRKTYRARNAKILLEGRLLQFSADLFQVLHILRGQGDADTVELAGL